MNLRDVGSTELTLELARRMAVIDKVSELPTAALVQELQQRTDLTHALQMDIADLLDSAAQLEAIRLWLPMDGLDDDLLWEAISESGKKQIIQVHNLETAARLRDIINDLEV